MKKYAGAVAVILFLVLGGVLVADPGSAAKDPSSSWLQRLTGVFGIFVLIFIAYLLSANRKVIRWRPVVWGLALQITFAMIVLSPALGQFFFNVVDQGIKKLLSFSQEGTAFVLQGVFPHRFIEQDPATGKIKSEKYPKSGIPQLAMEDMQDFPGFAQKLKKAKDPLSLYLRENLSETAQHLLGFYDPAAPPSLELQQALLDDLNKVLRSDKLYRKERFAERYCFTLDEAARAELDRGMAPSALWQQLAKPRQVAVGKQNDRWVINDADKNEVCSISGELEVYSPICISQTTRYFLAQSPTRVALNKLNRLLLEDAYPELARSGITEYVFIPKVSPATQNFAFWILPTIIFFSAFMTVLYHLGIMERIVKVVAWVMQRTMGTSGAESLSAAANIFVGQTEAPLVIKPFVDKMTKSELHAIMVGGFATVAGGVMAVYVGLLQFTIPGIAGHLMIASIMAAPAGLAMSKILFPETEQPVTAGTLKVEIEKPDANTIEAAARGATDGMRLVLNVVAVLIAFVALIAFVNYFLHFIPFPSAWTADGSGHLSLETLLGWIFSPITFCMGVPWKDCFSVGILLGEKIALTELLAYIHLSDLMVQGALSHKSAIIASYALCGFANFASIGIQIGGIGGIAPERRSDLAKMGMRAMLGGVLATCMTGTIAGILIS